MIPSKYASLSLVILLFVFPYKTFAYTPSEGKVTAILGPYIYRTNFAGSATGANSPNLTGIGLVAEGDLNSYGGLEVGMFHMNKLFFRQSNGLFIGEKIEMINITMGYRYWISTYLSTALAFSSSYAIGDFKIEHSDFKSGEEIDTSARDITEYGFDFSLQGEVWNKDNYSVVLDARYAQSVTAKQNEDANHYALLVGLKYVIQDKYPEKAPKPNKMK